MSKASLTDVSIHWLISPGQARKILEHTMAEKLVQNLPDAKIKNTRKERKRKKVLSTKLIGENKSGSCTISIVRQGQS